MGWPERTTAKTGKRQSRSARQRKWQTGIRTGQDGVSTGIPTGMGGHADQLLHRPEDGSDRGEGHWNAHTAKGTTAPKEEKAVSKFFVIFMTERKLEMALKNMKNVFFLFNKLLMTAKMLIKNGKCVEKTEKEN